MSAFEHDVPVVGAGLADMRAVLAAQGRGANADVMMGVRPLYQTVKRQAVACAPVTITQWQPQARVY